MKIKELKLHPFAGTRNRTVNFTPGLNVILGANEAGKSTLIKGLSCLFFTEPNLTQSKFDKELKSFLPLSGGDTIRISADIDLQGENYHVEKEFGAVKRAQLILPTNAELNNITDVQKQLLDKLGFSKATYEQVLITHQSDLANTIKALREEKDGTKAHLSNRLRSKLYELDGISVEKLKTEIDKLVEDYFDNWDDENNRPAKGKDFDNPHLKNVKRILRAYYTYRKLEKQLADAERYEKEIDLVNAQLQVKNKKYEELVSYKTQFAPVVEDARKRHEFETNRKMLQHEKTAIAEVAEKWPVEQDKFREAKRKSEELSQVSKGLDTNIKSLKQYQKSQELRTLYEKAKILCDEFVTEQENFKLIPQVNNDHINHVRKLERELDKLKNIIEAQELKIAIRAKKDISFGLKRGLNAAENISFSEGEMIQYDAAGRIQIEHEDFTIAIVSGKADIKQILKDIETKQAEIAAYFKEWNVENLDALDKLKADFDKAGLHIQSKHNEIKKLLNGQKLVDLEKEVSAIEKPHIAESLEMLQAQFNELQKQLAELQTIERYAAKQLQEWEMKFTSKDNLLDKLLENKSELSKIEKQISALKSLPENITDSQVFLDEFNRKMAELDKMQNEIISLKEQRLELDRNQPDDSTEDLQYNLTLEKKEFDTTLHKGKAYKRIQTELNTILNELDKDTFEPLKIRTEHYFHKLTGGKYNTVKMQETIPSEIELNGTWLPENLLSTGTLDLLALATRLAMADFYLEDKSGFIVLDDPLVNLDPARQEMAAACLREIAEEKQVIVLTCHPSHAAMLQGDLIEL